MIAMTIGDELGVEWTGVVSGSDVRLRTALAVMFWDSLTFFFPPLHHRFDFVAPFHLSSLDVVFFGESHRVVMGGSVSLELFRHAKQRK